MKKLLALTLALGLLLGLTACSDPKNPAAESNGSEDGTKTIYVITEQTMVAADGKVSHAEYIYGDDGCLTRLINRTGTADYSGGELEITEKSITNEFAVVCDEYGRPVTYTDGYGSGMVLEYTYDEQGRLENIVTRQNGEAISSVSYVFQEDGRLKSQTQEYLDSGSSSQRKYFYEDGLLICEEYYEEGSLIYTWEISCLDDGRISSLSIYDMEFNAVGTRKYSYAGTVTTVTSYDLDGNETSTQVMTYDENGNLLSAVTTTGDSVSAALYSWQAIRIPEDSPRTSDKP